jgi:hypothetical protein
MTRKPAARRDNAIPNFVPADIRGEYLRRKAEDGKSSSVSNSLPLNLLKALIFDERMEEIWKNPACTGEQLFLAAEGALYQLKSSGKKDWTASSWKRENRSVASKAAKLAKMIETEFKEGFDPWPSESPRVSWRLFSLSQAASASGRASSR